MANKDSLIRKQLIVKYAKTQNGYKKEGLYGIILTLRGHSTERGSIHNQRYVTYLHKYILLSENMDIMRSVDLCIKGSVKSRAFLLRRHACFPSPSGASQEARSRLASDRSLKVCY